MSQNEREAFRKWVQDPDCPAEGPIKCKSCKKPVYLVEFIGGILMLCKLCKTFTPAVVESWDEEVTERSDADDKCRDCIDRPNYWCQNCNPPPE